MKSSDWQSLEANYRCNQTSNFSRANSCTDDHCRIHRGRQAGGQSQRSGRYTRPSPFASSRLGSWCRPMPTWQWRRRLSWPPIVCEF